MQQTFRSLSLERGVSAASVGRAQYPWDRVRLQRIRVVEVEIEGRRVMVMKEESPRHAFCVSKELLLRIDRSIDLHMKT